MQTYNIILWRKPEKEETQFDEIAQRAFDSLSILQKYDEIFRPNYLTVCKKSDATRFVWTYKSFFEKLQSEVMKIGKKKVPELGYSLSFFSSLNDEEACGISVRVGNKDSKFVNSLVIHLPYSLEYSEECNSNMLKTLFCELVNSFEPYWGCVSSDQFEFDKLGYMSENTPLQINWLNYLSKEVESTISSKFFKKIKEMPDISYKNGILQISERALDNRNEKDVEYFKVINRIYFESKSHGNCKSCSDLVSRVGTWIQRNITSKK